MMVATPGPLLFVLGEFCSYSEASSLRLALLSLSLSRTRFYIISLLILNVCFAQLFSNLDKDKLRSFWMTIGFEREEVSYIITIFILVRIQPISLICIIAGSQEDASCRKPSYTEQSRRM